MKRFISTVLITVMFIFCVMPLTSCESENDKISNLIAKFETACNSLDVNNIIDCIHPDITNKIKVALGLVGVLTGQDNDEMLGAISAAIIDNGIVDADNFFTSIKIKVKDINTDSANGEVKAYISYRIGTEEITSDSKFICSKYDDKWYIKSLVL